MNPTHPTPIPLEQQEWVAHCWKNAQAHWSHFLLLRDPIHCPGQEAIAQIDLCNRQVSLDLDDIIEKNLLSSLEAILAHEIGHHVKYPGSILVQTRLRLLEKSYLPYEHYSLLNLFTDLLINEYLGRKCKEELIHIYQSFAAELEGQNDATFLFYLAIYESLWDLEEGQLMGGHHTRLVENYPYYRADAALMVQNLFHLGPNIYTQFLYFLSVTCRYINHIEARKSPIFLVIPCDCGGGTPSPEDWAEALIPSARELEAIRRALREGWISEADSQHMKDLERRISGLPGQHSHNAEQVPEIMAAFYRREAEKYLFRPPAQPSYGEAIVPTTLEQWEASDSTRSIDWLSTLRHFGVELGTVQPLKRVEIPELEGYEIPTWQPRMEIYLDVSGSMPNPIRERNAMTLAAQILTMATIRAGGWVRALMYSSSHVMYWNWCRSEMEMSNFLMHYVGGGTNFPFDVLRQSTEECRHQQPIRVIISDDDFERNYQEKKEHSHLFAEACHHSAKLILLLQLHKPKQPQAYTSAGADLILVEDMEDFPKVAAALSQALFSTETP